MPGTLLACKINNPYTITFWTLERNPDVQDLKAHATHVANLYKSEHPGASIFVAPEVSQFGYKHDHVLMKTPKPARFTKRFMKDLEANLGWKKPNGTKMSIRAFHPRRGSPDDFESIKKYLTESKYKVKPLSADTIELDDVAPRIKALLWDRMLRDQYWALPSMAYSTHDEEFKATYKYLTGSHPWHQRCAKTPEGKQFLKLYAEYNGVPPEVHLLPVS